MPKLRLSVTHTHAGQAYPAGAIIEVDEHTARWLMDRDIATLPGSDALPAEPATAPDPQPAPQPAISTRSTKPAKE